MKRKPMKVENSPKNSQQKSFTYHGERPALKKNPDPNFSLSPSLLTIKKESRRTKPTPAKLMTKNRVKSVNTENKLKTEKQVTETKFKTRVKTKAKIS